MVQTITPAVHGGSRRRWKGSVALHVFGATLSAAILGAGLGAGGAALGAPWGRGGILGVGAVAMAYAAREIFRLPVPIPELRRQVPEWWRGAFGPRLAAFLYGFALGPGFFTHLRHGTLVVVGAAAVALGDPVLGIVMLAPFGVARAIGVAVASAARTEPGVRTVGERLERIGSGAAPRVANATALVLITAIAVVSSPDGAAPPSWLWPLLLAASFAWAAAAKTVRREEWRGWLRAYALPVRIESLASVAVPSSEIFVAALLLTGSFRIGSALALVMLGAFSFAVVRAPKPGDGRLPCGCFGGRARRSSRWLLSRNAALGLVAVASLTVGTAVPLPALPLRGELVPAALAAAGLLLAVSMLYRAATLVGLTESRRVRRGDSPQVDRESYGLEKTS